MTRYYYWPRIIRFIKQFVRNYRSCHRAKVFREKYYGFLKSLLILERRWAYISIDFITGLSLSNDYYGRKCVNILVIIDRLIKMIKYILINGIIAKDIAKVFYLYV